MEYNEFYNRIKSNLREKIGDKTVAEWSLYLKSLDNFSFQVEHTGTIFKLYSLFEYLIYPYISIIANQRNKYVPYKMLYIDLFAGSGLNEIMYKKRKHYICGSPILAILASHFMSKKRRGYNCYFDYMLLFEIDQKSNSILLNRCKQLIEDLSISDKLVADSGYGDHNVKIIGKNINDRDEISTLVKYLRNLQSSNKVHIMLFVDPPTPASLEMQTLKQILTFPGDMIILLHAGIFAKQVKLRRYKPERIQAILDIDAQKATNLLDGKHPRKYLEQYFVEKCEQAIRNVRINGIYTGSPYRDISIRVPLRTTKSNYYLVYATRTTGGKSIEWQEPTKAFANWISNFSDSGPLAADILNDLQTKLGDFFGY